MLTYPSGQAPVVRPTYAVSQKEMNERAKEEVTQFETVSIG